MSPEENHVEGFLKFLEALNRIKRFQVQKAPQTPKVGTTQTIPIRKLTSACYYFSYGTSFYRESTRLLPVWSGFDSRAPLQMWVEFVVRSRFCSERFFSGYSGYPLSSRIIIIKFQFDLGTVDEKPPCGCTTANSQLLIYFIL